MNIKYESFGSSSCEKKASKRWTKEETNLILGYIIEKGYLEKPTAQIFYRKMLDEIEIEDATWQLVKYRVRNLKTTLKRANEYMDSVRAGDEEGFSTAEVEEKVRKMCPHYDQLAYIFNSNTGEIKMPNKFEYIGFSEVSHSSENSLESPSLPSAETWPSQIKPKVVLEAPPPPSPPAPEPSTPKIENKLPGNMKRRAIRSEYEDICKMEAKRDAFLEKKLELEKEKIKIEWKKIKIQEEEQAKRFELDQEMQHMKLKIEEEKLQIAFQLRKYEIDQKERIAKYEIDLKYNKRT